MEVKADQADNIAIDERIKRLQLAIKYARESTVQLSGAISDAEVRQWEDHERVMLVQAELCMRMGPVRDAYQQDTAKAAAEGKKEEADRNRDLTDRCKARIGELTYETVDLNRLLEIVDEFGFIDLKVAVLGACAGVWTPHVGRLPAPHAFVRSSSSSF
jgi:hypothetical protein